jgi:hypothetical protein
MALIPALTQQGRVAYADKFGNVRLEMADAKDTAEKLQVGSKVSLHLGEEVRLDNLHVVSRLTDIPEGELGVYYNPADPITSGQPHYVELVRRVSNPNTNSEHAYATLVSCLGNSAKVFVPKWDGIDIRITA